MKTKKYLKVPTPAAILFIVLFFATSFYSGVTFTRSKLQGDTLSAKNVFAVEKSETPELEFYVMSFCPYGNQIEDVIRPVADLLGDKANIRPRYIFDKIEGGLASYCGPQRVGDPSLCSVYVQNGYFQDEATCKKTIEDSKKTCTNESAYIKAENGVYYSSLHGRVEANQNVREICAYNLAQDKKMWWNFVDNVNLNCNDQNADTCWQDQAQKSGLDVNQITTCFNEQTIDLIEAEIAATTAKQVTASPTVLVNGVNFPPQEAYTQDGTGSLKVGKKTIQQSQYRSPNTIKEAVCSAFKKSPRECNTTLDSVPEAQAVAQTGAACN